MSSYMVDSCCGRFDLKTGCLIIGYLSLVSEISLLVFSMCSMKVAESAIVNDKPTGWNMFVLSILYLLAALISLPFTIIFCVGVHNNKRNYVKTYLIVSVISLVLTTVFFFASFAGTIKIENIIGKVVSIALGIYFILVIRSYYYKMEEQKPAISNIA